MGDLSRELEIPWEEEFILSKNKKLALRKLLPTTEDYYFYNILHRSVLTVCGFHNYFLTKITTD